MKQSGLRILISGINYAPEPTGIAPYTYGLARGMLRKGHDVRVLTAFPHYPQWRVMSGYSGLSHLEAKEGVLVHRLRHYVPRGRTGLARALSEVSFGARTVGVRWQDPDVILCVSPALLSSTMVTARARVGRRRAAIGLIVQDLYSAGLAESGRTGRLEQGLVRIEAWTAQRADGIAVIHDRFRRRVSTSLGVPEGAISVIRNWTHISTVAPFSRESFRRERGWGGKHVVLHAGAMGEKQDLGNVVEAARLAAARRWNLHFVLMGDGNQRRSLEAQARGVDGIEFLDPLPDEEYGRALRSADALLVNERSGVVEMAVPSKLTSYFSSGVPVLAATELASTTSEELAASGSGVRIPPGDPAALAEAAMDLCSDRDRATALGALGPRYCHRVLSEEQAIDGYEAWIRDLMVRARVRRGEL